MEIFIKQINSDLTKGGTSVVNNMFSTVIAVAFLGLLVFIMIGMIVRAVKQKYGQPQTVKAVVVDKHIEETFSRYSGNGNRERYMIVFSAQGETLSFYVSEFSFGGYQINEEGVLTYQGGQIIDFK